MFHTFQTDAAAANQSSSKNNPKSRRHASTTHACEECRRRKIRCDGKQPCSHCEWYKHPKLCRYSKKQPRIVPSQKLLDELQTSLNQSQSILGQLFPNADITQLGSMSRQELVDMMLGAGSSRTSSSSSTSPHTQTSSEGPRISRVRSSGEDSANLEALEQEPVPDLGWGEVKTSPSGVPQIPDDVNALSMSVSQQSSYVGVSSVAAALRVISKITTALESVIISSPHKSQLPTESNSPRPVESSETVTAIAQPRLTPDTLVNAYFSEVHPMIPMIDEARFRAEFASKQRTDAAWLALLNTVYSMGTIAASNAEDNSHLLFYHRARQYLDLESFAGGHIEALQALGILGGYYLHYESRPNMASAIMGAAMRMAVALGLHREYAEVAVSNQTAMARSALLIPREVRRRTWWSLFCLDTWGSTTTGRPSLGRISPGVNCHLPQSTTDRSSPGASSSVSAEDVSVILLSHETMFCKIATRVQDRLAEQPLLPFEETMAFDAELRNFYNNLPIMMRWPEPCPKVAQTPRAVLSWRYHNLRIVLYRPILLNNALRSSLESSEGTSEEEVRMVETCRQAAADAIDDIRNQWVPSHIAGWNAVWLLFQAAMVPLVTLFAEYNRRNFRAVNAAQAQVQVVLDQLELMQDWSVTAKRTRDVVLRIFERNKLLVDQAEHILRQQAQQHQRNKQMGAANQARARQDFQPGQVDPSHLMGSPYGQQAHASQQQPMAGAAYGQPSQLPSEFAAATGQMGGVLPQADGMLPHQHAAGLAGHMGMVSQNQGESTPTGVGFVSEAELNDFWHQMMWGETDMSNFMMDTSLDGMPYQEENLEYPLNYQQ